VQGWCGIDFAYRGMQNTDMIVALNTGSSITVTEYYSKSQQKPTQVLQTLPVTSALVNSQGIFVSFTRALKPTNPLTKAFSIGMTSDLSFAYLTTGGQGFAQHNTVGYGAITFGATNTSSNFIPNGVNYPSVALDNNFHMSWGYNDPDNIDSIFFSFNVIPMQCYHIQNWCGISFVHGMEDTELIVLRSTDKTSDGIVAHDYYSIAKAQPSTTLLDLTVTSAVYNSSGIFGTFTRNMTNLPSNAKKISQSVATGLSFAYLPSGSSFSQHSTTGTGEIVFGVANSTSNYTTGGGTGSTVDLDFYSTHGEYMTIMWLGVVQVAIMLVRYFKWWPLSQVFHSMLGAAVATVTLYSAYAAYKKDKLPFSSVQADEDLRKHSRLAFTICATAMTQAILGVCYKLSQLFKNNVMLISRLRKAHQMLGWAIPLTALVNIKYGWTMRKKSTLDDYVYPAYGVLCAALVLFEIRHRWGHHLMRHWRTRKQYFLDYFAFSESVRDERSESLLVDNIAKRHIDVLAEIVQHQREWVFYDDYVLDVSGFKWNHPGGMFMFKDVFGQDVGKFINGCSSAEDTRPHYHSRLARELLRPLRIGRVAFPTEFLVNLLPSESHKKMLWTLTDRTVLAMNTFCLEFTSVSWELARDPPGYEWMGKHFLMIVNVQGRTINRYYSVMMVNLAEWAQEVREEGFSCRSYSMRTGTNALRLHIKHYDGGAMTSHLTTMQLGSPVLLKGPLGPGLCVESFANKDYLIFGAGTGIIPFFDIIHAVWSGRLQTGTFHIYVSFRDEATSFGVDLLEATAKRYPSQVKVFARLGEAGFQLHGEFWKHILPIHIAERAWVCGPPAFNRKIQRILIDEGFDSNRVILL
jgi:NAD(P)H-flavin reductase